MNSDQIRERFGSYGVELLAQEDNTRLANLYSVHDGTRVCRTLALTRFQLPVAGPLTDAHLAIRDGASIGATLRAAGWRVVKSDAAFATAAAGPQFARLAASTVTMGELLALQVYTLQVSDSEHWHPYAVIAEAYHPAHIPPYADVEDAAALLPTLPLAEQEAMGALVRALAEERPTTA